MLYKRCEHDWPKCRCAYWYEFVLHGERYRRSTRTANRQTADRIEQRRRIAILDGKDEEPGKPYSLKKLIEDYTDVVNEEHATAEKSIRVMTAFLAAIGDEPVKKISPFTISKWKLARAKDVSQSTVNREMNVLRGMFSQAVVWRKLKEHPMAEVDAFAVDDRRVRVLSDDELRAVLACDDAFVALVCRVTLECLPRLSEVLGIERSHIGPSWIEFRRKGGKVTRAAVTDDLRRELLARSGQRIFGEGDANTIPTEQTASNRIARKLQALGILDASHHTMRHTGVTLMLERGVNPRVIQTLAGWSSLRMLERYGHARDAEIRRAVEGNAAHLDRLVGRTALA
jgi:integrase